MMAKGLVLRVVASPGVRDRVRAGIAPRLCSLNNLETRMLPFHLSDTAKLLAGHYRIVAGRLGAICGLKAA